MSKTRLILPLSFVIILLIGASLYLISGIELRDSHKLFYYLFISLILTISLSFLIAVFRMRKNGYDTYFKYTSHAFLVAVTSVLLTTLVLMVTDILRIVWSVPSLINQNEYSLIGRSIIVSYILIIILMFSIFTFVYGIVKGKYAFRVIKHVLYFDDLPKSFDGFTITQISDVHAGSFGSIKQVKKGINLINVQKSDLFVFTGDLVNNKAEEIVPYINMFTTIKSPYGQFSILGNHDYGDYVKWPSNQQKIENLNQLKAYHKDMGFKLLLDEHIKLEKDGDHIILLGVENWGLGFGERGDLEKALTGTQSSDFKVLLSHDPSHWENQVKLHPNKIQLTLAGHTHGMQFGVEAFGFKWSPVKYRYKHWAGIKIEQHKTINVNRGFGFIGFSGRVGIWPEITVIELRCK